MCGIEYAHFAAFADQLFQQRHHRALAQIVGIFLERQADHADPLRLQIQHRINGALQMLLVARTARIPAAAASNPARPRDRSAPAGPWAGRSRRTRNRASDRPAKCSASHPGTACSITSWRVDAQAFAQRADLIGEGDLHRVKCIAGVLDHFRGPQRDQAAAGRRGGAYRSATCSHGVMRRTRPPPPGATAPGSPAPPSLPAKIPDSRPRSHCGWLRKRRQHHFFAGARKNRAADGNDQRLRAARNLRRNFVDSARRNCARPRFPFFSEGVPTQTSAMSASAIPAR